MARAGLTGADRAEGGGGGGEGQRKQGQEGMRSCVFVWWGEVRRRGWGGVGWGG